MDTLPDVDGRPFWQSHAAPGANKDTFNDVIDMMNTVYTGIVPHPVQHWRLLPWAQGLCASLGCLLLAALHPACRLWGPCTRCSGLLGWRWGIHIEQASPGQMLCPSTACCLRLQLHLASLLGNVKASGV